MADEQNFREAFQLFDQDQDGVVSPKELKKMMQMLGNELTEQEVKDVLKESGSGSAGISYSQFCKLMGVGIKQSRDFDPEEEMRDAFRLFDHDKDGKLSPKDMTKSLAHFGVQLTDREVDQLIGEATLSNERNVSYEVFKRVMSAARP